MEKDQDRALARLLIKHASAAVGHLGHIAPPPIWAIISSLCFPRKQEIHVAIYSAGSVWYNSILNVRRAPRRGLPEIGSGTDPGGC